MEEAQERVKKHDLHTLLAWSDEIEQRSQDLNERCAAQRERLAALVQRCVLVINPQTNHWPYAKSARLATERQQDNPDATEVA